MPPLPPAVFAERVRDLSQTELAAFCAALWSVRGWETEIREDGAVEARRGDQRAVIAPVAGGFRARVERIGDDPVPGDATAVVAPGRLPTAVPDGAEVLDAEALHGLALYGLPRERADDVLREHLDVPAVVPADFDETALDRALTALSAASAVPYVREAVAVAFVAALVLGVAVALPSGTGGPTAAPGSGGAPTDNGTDVNATTADTDGTDLVLNASTEWTTGLGNSPDEWAAFGGGPDRTAWRPNVSGPTPPVTALFNRSVPAPVVASPVVVNGSIYVGLYNGALQAYGTTADGNLQKRWSIYFGFSSSVTATPTVRDDTVYVGTVRAQTSGMGSRQNRPNLRAVNRTNGAVEWAAPLPSVPFSSPVVVDDTLYVGGSGGAIHALNATSGDARWRTPLGGTVYTSPAVVGDTVYATTSNGVVAALNANDGGAVWRQNRSTFLGSSPAVRDGRVYLGTGRGTVLALDAGTGATVWNTSVNATVYSSPAATDERVYVGTENGSVYALNASTGAVAWQRRAGGRVFSSPAVANGTLYVGVGAPNGSVLALNATTGETVWRFDTVGQVTASPAVVPGAVVVGDFDGHVYVLGRGDTLSRVARQILERREEMCGDPACRDVFTRAVDNGSENGTEPDTSRPGGALLPVSPE